MLVPLDLTEGKTDIKIPIYIKNIPKLQESETVGYGALTDPTTPLIVRMPKDLLVALDEWRRQRPELPNRQDAIRGILRSKLDKFIPKSKGKVAP